MDGRRINSKTRKYNPLFILFLCLIAAVIVLLIVTMAMGAKLGKANKSLKAAETRVLELEKTVAQLESDLEILRNHAGTDAEPTVEPTNEPANEPEPKPAAETAPAQQPQKQETPKQETQKQETPKQETNSSSWLDLSGHSEVKYKPTELLSGYQTYYTSEGVNLRSGPGTDYGRVTTVNRGTKVQVAARDGAWSFVKVDGKFGWIKTEYLGKTTPPAATSSSSSSSSAEATSGSLKKN